MKISIVTINYNNAFGLNLTIKSVLSQVSREIYELEYIVIDGGSIDSSKELLIEHNNSIDFWISETDRGIYHAMNKGILKSTGDYIIFLNSGDYFTNDSILQCCASFIDDDSVDIYYGDTIIRILDDDIRHNHPAKLDLTFLRKDNINHQASLIRRELFREFGLYPEHYRLASDYWLYLIAFLHGKNYKHINLALVFYDMEGLSAIDGFKKYSEERNNIWNDLMKKDNYYFLFTEEIDKLIQENNKLKNIMTHKIIRIAMWVQHIMDKIKNIMINYLNPHK